MLNPQALQLRVGVDVGSRCHSVAVGLTDGRLLEEFEIPHTAAGFGDFFARIEGHATRHPYSTPLSPDSMSEVGGKADLNFGPPHVCLCRVGPGNFTPSPSQNRT